MMNAIQPWMSCPRASRKIELRFSSDQDAVRIDVSDNDPGLSSGFLAAPFQSFRTDGPDELGIGLTISRSIAETHGGGIEIRDRLDRTGVTSTVRLPAERNADQSPGV